MANIPAEKTSSGAAWLPWLLGLLALVALVWLGLELFDDEPDADEVAGLENNVGLIDDVELGDDDDDLLLAPDTLALGTVGIGVGTITNVGALSETIAAVRDGVVDASGLAVDLDGIEVQELTGDSTFAIGTGDDRTLVVLSSLGESEVGPGDGSDGVFDVNEGATISVDGTLMRYTPDMRGTSDLSADERGVAERRQYVIVARDPSSFSIAR